MCGGNTKGGVHTVIVMPSNGSHWWVHYWAGRRPKCLGHLYSPGGQRGPFPHLPFAVDNGAFGGFEEDRWKALLRWVCLSGYKPMWVAVPDFVGDAEKTIEMWETHKEEAERYGWPLAFVLQDGIKKEDVPKDAQVVFVGGSTEWKEKTVEYWCNEFPRVHVGRVNGYRMLRKCADAGAESCDGTGWGRGDKRQLLELLQFLEEEESKEAGFESIDWREIAGNMYSGVV